METKKSLNSESFSRRSVTSIDGVSPLPRARIAPISYESRPVARRQIASPQPIYRTARMEATKPTEVEVVPSVDAPSTTPIAEHHLQAVSPLPESHTLHPKKRDRRVVKRSRAKMLLVRSVILVAVGLLGAGGFFTWRGYTSVHKVFQGTTTVAALSTKDVAPDLLNGEGDGRVNILLLGVGGQGHDGADLTDTMIVLSVDPVNNTAALLSIPRDLWVKMPVNYFGDYQKINAAYSAGKYKFLGKTDASNVNKDAITAGFASADQAVSDVLGIAINYHVLVDFSAFKQAVDAVGGVDVNVPTALYDPTMAWENGNNPVLAPAGQQIMNGKEALLYARSRHTSSDFARSERQRQLIVALKQKVLTLDTLGNPAKIDTLLSAFGDNVYSDLSPTGASRLYSIMKNIPDSQIVSLGLTNPPHPLVQTDSIGSTSVVRPIAGFNVYSDIQAYVKSQLPDGYLVKEKAPVTVVSSHQTTIDDQTATLKQYGYTVLGGQIAPYTMPSQTVVVDLTGGAARYTRHYLEERYHTQVVQSLPVGIQVPEGTQFAILLP